MSSSKKQTVGYRYSLGMHMALCHGPIDHLARIDVDAKEAWIGYAQDGTQNINKEDLFGGDEREGGVSGPIDIMLGKKTQTKNTYLQARLGSAIPAFRGVFGVVLNQMYLGMNPYLKKWAFRTQRIYATSDEAPQWYEGTAAIGTTSDVAMHFVLDYSNSMNPDLNGGTDRLGSMKTALTNALTPLVGIPAGTPIDIKVVAFADTALSIQRLSASGSDIQEVIDFINNTETTDFINGKTDFAVGFADIQDFFALTGGKERISIVITDGEPASATPPETPQENIDRAAALLFGVSGISAYGFNITLTDITYTVQLDNTPEDGVPVVEGEDSGALTSVIAGALYAQLDMNPAHIIRECLTNAVWGMGYPAADMDDTTYTAAADTLLSEGMGISLLWDRQIPIEKFVTEIIKHIDAALFVDRQTGKFILKLIRDDYDVGTLITLDESNIDKITNLNRNSFGELTNSITVTYWDSTTEENGSVTVQDTALIQMQNAVINTALQYPGFTNSNLASRIAMRDLKTLSTPLWTCTVYTNQVAKDLNIGDVFKLTWPDYGINEVVMRISGMGFGDGKSNQIQIQATQDQFGVPSASGVATPDDADGWQPIDTTALPSPAIMAQEAPYYELTQILGQLDIDTKLTDNNDLGYISVAAGRPASEAHQNAVLSVDSGTGYVESDTLDFSPFAYLTTDVAKLQTIIPIENGTDLDIVTVGEFAQIDNELVRVDAVSTTEVTLGRGILDTIPVKHLAGAAIVFWDPFPASDEVEYIATETINVKVLPSTLANTLDVTIATAYPILLASRAFLPFRPANFRAEGDNDPPTTWFPTYPVLLEWDERNRVQETGGVFLDWEDGIVAAEAGTTYDILIDAYEEDQTTLIANITTILDIAVTSYSLASATLAGQAGAPFIRVQVTSKRDGYLSYQSPELFFRGSFKAPSELDGYFLPEVAPTIYETRLRP